MSALQRCVTAPVGRHTASVVFLHGSGDTGQGLREWIKQTLKQDLLFQHIKVVYPTAPARPYTPMMGALSTVWFDRYKISNNCPEHLESIESMSQELRDLINEEVKTGIPKHRIIIGGFSMGGAMAMHLAYKYYQDVAGVFALSSFLNKGSVIYKVLPIWNMLFLFCLTTWIPEECQVTSSSHGFSFLHRNVSIAMVQTEEGSTALEEAELRNINFILLQSTHVYGNITYCQDSYVLFPERRLLRSLLSRHGPENQFQCATFKILPAM